MDAVTREEMLDVLMDLKHDLGKYIRMPLAMLPAGAGDEEVTDAVRRGLLETRRGPAGVRSARGLWDEFTVEAKGALGNRAGWQRLESAVFTALTWEERLAGPLPRLEVDRDLASVGASIQALIEELLDG
jgi:hypothetical protein